MGAAFSENSYSSIKELRDSNMQELHLWCCSIGPVGALAAGPTLAHVHLADDSLGNAGSQAIVDTLRTNPWSIRRPSLREGDIVTQSTAQSTINQLLESNRNARMAARLGALVIMQRFPLEFATTFEI